jgi:hypothetical protein
MAKFFYPTVNGQSKAQILEMMKEELDSASWDEDSVIPEDFKIDKKKMTDKMCQTIVNELAVIYDEGVDTDEEDLNDERQEYFVDIYTKFFK